MRTKTNSLAECMFLFEFAKELSIRKERGKYFFSSGRC